MQNFQGQYAHYINLRYSRVGSLFQGRYKSLFVQEKTHALVLARYIHQNPVEAGLVQSLEDYPWSSYPCFIGRFPKWRWLETKWLLDQFHEDAFTAIELFRGFHQKELTRTEEKILKRIDRISKVFPKNYSKGV